MDKFSSKKNLLNFLGIRENFLYPNFSGRYGRLEKAKKSGGVRIIEPPYPKLKQLQRRVLDEILSKQEHLGCVYGLSKDKTILHNAKFHSKNSGRELLTLDIENFFPSVSKKTIKKFFKSIGYSDENAKILTKICTVNGALPQGAPTSALLASLSCRKMDKEIFNFCKRRNLLYTRYFDDITLSGKSILPSDETCIKRIALRNGFKMNKNKRIFFASGAKKIVNGIVLDRNHVSVSDGFKEEIKDAYNRFIHDGQIRSQRSFFGKLGFYLFVNRKEGEAFYNNLSRTK